MNYTKDIKIKLSKKVSPKLLDGVSRYTEKTKKASSFVNASLQTPRNVVWVLENSNWVLKPVGKVVDYVNRPANAIYNDGAKPYVNDEFGAISTALDCEPANIGLAATVISSASKASNLVAEKKLGEKIERITALLVKLDKYVDKIEGGTNHLRDLQQQEAREKEFARLNINDYKNLSDAEVEVLLGINELSQMDLEQVELEDEFEVLPNAKERKEQSVNQQKLQSVSELPGAGNSLEEDLSDALADNLDRTDLEYPEDLEGTDVDGKVYEKQVCYYNDSKVGQGLKKGHNKAVAVNEKINEYSEMVDLIRELLAEIDTANITSYKKTEDAIVSYFLKPVIKVLDKRGNKIGKLIQKGGIAEDARGLAEVIGKYNDKVKLGSEYFEQGTDYVGDKLAEREQRNRVKEYANLENVSYSFKDKSDVEVFEEELVIEEPQAKVEEKPKTGGFGGLFSRK